MKDNKSCEKKLRLLVIVSFCYFINFLQLKQLLNPRNRNNYQSDRQKDINFYFIIKMPITYSNPDLKQKYQQNSSFKQLMDSNQKHYQQKLQQSYYSDLSKINQHFIHVSTQSLDEKNLNGSKIYSEKKNLVYVYSHFQPDSPAEMHKYFLHFIQAFPEPKQPFYLIYVNSSQSSKSKCWGNFKNKFLEELPLKYLLYMEKLVLIRPSFLDKASSMIQLGVQNKFFNNKLQKYDSLKSYFSSIGKKFDEFKKNFPSQVLQDQPDEALVKTVFSSFICNFDENRTSLQAADDLSKFAQTIPPPKIPKKQSTPLKRKKKGLQNYPTGQQGIPLALELLIFYFTQIPRRCETEGLFRKCTSIDDEKDLLGELEKQNYEILTGIQNQITVASTMKRFLSNLEPPIVPYQNYQRLIQDHSLDSIISEIHMFPLINFMTLMHLLKFLRQNIIPFQKKNLMTTQNVAICLAPCLMKSKQITVKQLLYATINVEITKIMIKNFEQIFGNSQEQKRISNKTYRIFRRNSKLNQSPLKIRILPQNQKTKEIQLEKYNEQNYQCPQDFLRPVINFLENQKQSSTQKLSQNSEKNEVQNPKNNRIGVKIMRAEKPKSDMYLEKYDEEEQLKEMKKHKSYKNIPLQPQKKQMEICGKSDCDKNDICEEQINLPNSEGVSRLNKLRIHRSKMAN